MLGGETEGYRESLVFPKEMDITGKLVTVPRPQSGVHAGMTEPLLSISAPLLL